MYTIEEEQRAKRIREMTPGGEKRYFIRCFIIGTGKNFPHEQSMIYDQEIEEGAANVIMKWISIAKAKPRNTN